MPYKQYDEGGNLVCLYNALAPEFQQARNYLSTGKLQARLEEYDAVHGVAARLGVSFDDAVADICSRWPEWTDNAELTAGGDEPQQADEENGDGGVEQPAGEDVEAIHADDVSQQDGSGANIGEIRTAYEASHDAEPDQVGLGESPVHDLGGDGLDGGDASGDYLAEEAGDSPSDDDPAGNAVDEPDPAQLGGVLIQGDALTTSKALLSWQVDAIEAERLGVYDEDEITSELAALRNRAMGAREYGWTALNDAENEQLQALETFEGHIRAIQAHSRSLRGQIRDAADEPALALIDIQSGWPE